ncbi:MAG: hypothetical protein Q7U98_09125 [Methylicorpusculum sp.]|uniref:hypothetical protein n=1 Tax=Methylicorpusculum sp. TaxID=2713644 RepID=UPI00271F1FED|nr:hypothetical protein [Methylicorpusculum sp.]MDO8845885.1 hypothetical protein [Methylicorpusculum sp.]MDO8939310.1 hypothetical protein [Methylicorpusculum sp.]MDO9240282.1 hypothetical protein [Methylicorpusculum sp.]MDP2201670.1 hypothetical protein [Methylicorpusculum sp.]
MQKVNVNRQAVRTECVEEQENSIKVVLNQQTMKPEMCGMSYLAHSPITRAGDGDQLAFIGLFVDFYLNIG